jgi:hypothetical protein
MKIKIHLDLLSGEVVVGGEIVPGLGLSQDNNILPKWGYIVILGPSN